MILLERILILLPVVLLPTQTQIEIVPMQTQVCKTIIIRIRALLRPRSCSYSDWMILELVAVNPIHIKHILNRHYYLIYTAMITTRPRVLLLLVLPCLLFRLLSLKIIIDISHSAPLSQLARLMALFVYGSLRQLLIIVNRAVGSAHKHWKDMEERSRALQARPE